MRFKHWPRHAFTDTSRKRAALRRKQRLEREALPRVAKPRRLNAARID